jgi:hypothetical protein
MKGAGNLVEVHPHAVEGDDVGHASGGNRRVAPRRGKRHGGGLHTPTKDSSAGVVGRRHAEGRGGGLKRCAFVRCEADAGHD